MNLLPKSTRLKSSSKASSPSRKELLAADHVLVLMPQRVKKGDWAGVPGATLFKELRRQVRDPAAPLSCQVGRQGVTLLSVPDKGSVFDHLANARAGLSLALTHNPATLAVTTHPLKDHLRASAAEAVVAAAHAAVFLLPDLKSRRSKIVRLRKLAVYGTDGVHHDRLRVEADANNLVRHLATLPPNVLDAARFQAAAGTLAEAHGFEFEVFDELELQRRGANAFLAVARGNAHSDAAIVRLRRPGTGSKPRHITLVGKGVCYDTGGINVKPASYMLGMHEDMTGAALALANFIALAELLPEVQLDVFLALTENRINGDCYTPNEVVRASNGVTIEVIHTDAEGRMALADTLVMASATKPDLLLDFATLTGGCVNAITTRYSGAFCNRLDLHAPVIAAGEHSGERVWPFPQDSDFDEALKSEVADIKQCTAKGGGDHILAARFLNRFVNKNTAWVHVDLSSCTNEGGLGHVGTATTGFGVRFTTALVMDEL